MGYSKKTNMAYSQAGVDYSSIDPIKLLAQDAAAGTASNLSYFNMHEVTPSRGESAYVWEEKESYKALVVEGLGTKNLVADAMRMLTGKTYYDQVAQDTVAMIVNDLIVVGALPNIINAYFAIGDSAWMDDRERAADLINGWAAACMQAGAVWGGGETPALKGIINPDTIDLAGSASGSISPKSRLVLGDKLTEDDVIILIESSGIHANGLTLARSIAGTLKDGYGTKLNSGQLYGEALLKPTHIYVPFVRGLLEANVELHYMVNITGHGWRKLMRATASFSYIFSRIPQVPEEFTFIQDKGHVSTKEMYGNFNMGAGFAVFVPESEADRVVDLAKASGLGAWVAGTVQKGPKRVVIDPLDITYESDTLGVR